MEEGNFELGELFMVGCHDTELTGQLEKRLTAFPFGGMILFSRNIKSFDQCVTFTSELHKMRKDAGKKPFFIAVDEEGGTVSRMPDDNYIYPGARAIAQTNCPALASQSGYYIGALLTYLGININLAPVLDVNINPLNPGIGIRSYGSSPDVVASFSESFISGLQMGGVFPCAKHFPGKGDITKDSHITLPVCVSTESDMENIHLAPFRKAISCGVPFIMTSHAVYKNFDKTQMPGTLSKYILTDILRNKLGFNGLIISDDLEMGAMSEYGQIHENAYKAILAGCDIILICHDQNKQEQVYNYLKKKLGEDPVFFARCNESYKRIIELKKNIMSKELSFPELIRDSIQKIAKSSISVIKNENNLVPLPNNPDKNILIAGSRFRSNVEVEMIGREPYDIADFYYGLKESIESLDLISWDINPADPSIELPDDNTLDKYDLIMLFSNNANLFESQRKVIRKILSKFGEKTILAVTKNPEDHLIFPEAKNVILTFGYNKPNLDALSQILLGYHSMETGK